MNNKSEISNHLIDEIYKWLILGFLFFLREKNAVFNESNIIFNLPVPPLWEGILILSKALYTIKKARDVTALLGTRSRFALRLAEQSGLRQCGLRSVGKEVYGYN